MAPEQRKPLQCDSSIIQTSKIPARTDVRQFYLQRAEQEQGPIICHSSFIPYWLVEHLMRNKRDEAIACKFVEGSAITNMEGALHSFVTALATIKMFGDYAYIRGHRLLPFQLKDGQQQYRKVILSTAIHLDFETDQVAWQLYKIQNQEVSGRELPLQERPSLGSVAEQESYDNDLQQHAIYHLTENRQLPAKLNCIKWTVKEATSAIENDLESPEPRFVVNKAVQIGSHCLSLEMMQKSYRQILANDLVNLSKECPDGFIYTWDPPCIFARYVDATLLNRLMMHALRDVFRDHSLPKIKVFAFNDYLDTEAIKFLQLALQVSNLNAKVPKIISKSKLEFTPGLALVLHNNSDGFGQNIETEICTSLDGAIGSYSNAAAVLERGRSDLLAEIRVL